MKKVFNFIIFTVISLLGYSQSAPISIDGLFDDWTAQSSIVDSDETLNGVDILAFEVTNDEHFLFLKITLDTELNLKEDDPVAHNIFLDLDTDNDPSTGFSAQDGYGAELSIDFSGRRAFFNINGGSSVVGFSDFSARFGPTVTSTEFELAIARNATPDGVNALFSSSTIRVLFRNANNNDALPNDGEVFYYTFDETPVPDLIPINLDKENDDFIRVVAYNTLFNGLVDASQSVHLGKIIKVLNPDIIGFSECGTTTAHMVRNLMNAWLPLGNGTGWHILKYDDLITASRWPFIEYWPDLYRQFPALIDLPDDQYATDLLFTNVHLRCCSNNTDRQDQVDEYVSFMLDAKSAGGDITLPTNTPFVYAGDLNLVGYAQQLNTLITGDIQGVQQFGPGAPLDWDDTDVTDQICRQTDKRMAYTWRNDSSSYPPGRLDFVIFSDAVMTAEKSFSVQTAVMSQERLDLYDLDASDSREASDHFPVTVDFSIHETVDVSSPPINIRSIFPNPAVDQLNINFEEFDVYQIQLIDALGRVVLNQKVNEKDVILDLKNINTGLFYLDIKANDGRSFRTKVVVKH